MTASRTGHRLRLELTDEGSGTEGIAPKRVFERFAHSASPTTSTAAAFAPSRPSFGTGPALVREIAARQGGAVRAQQTSLASTTVVLELSVETPSLGLLQFFAISQRTRLTMRP